MQSLKAGDLCLLHAWFKVDKVVIYLYQEERIDARIDQRIRDCEFDIDVVFLDDMGKLYKIPKNFVISCEVLSAFEDVC